MNKKKIVLITCGTIIGIIVFAVISLFLLGLLAALFIPMVVPPRPDDTFVSKQISNKLYKSFEASCDIYTLNEGKSPDKFSQFVSLKKKNSANDKFDMEFMADNYMFKPDNDAELEYNKLDVAFRTGYKVTYNLGKDCNISMTTGKP